MELEFTPAFPVHVVDEAAGERLEEQVEDGHAGAELPCVREDVPWVEDANVDDVQEDGGHQATQKLQDRPAQGPGVTTSLEVMGTAMPPHAPITPPPHIPIWKLHLCPTVPLEFDGKQTEQASRTLWRRCLMSAGPEQGLGGSTRLLSPLRP